MPRYKIDDIKTYLLARSELGEAGCRVWTGAVHQKGYGRFTWRARGYRAHRAAYEAYVGPIPVGMLVCHRCDNPRCINPDHLFLGTVADNNRDMHEKGRQARGTKCGQSKLTPWRVRVLRDAYARGGWSYKRLARRLGLSFGTVHSAITRKTWSI